MAASNILILAILTTESSFAQGIERTASTVPDTVQIWSSPDGQIRVRTYGIDHDIQAFLFGTQTDSELIKETALSYINNHYKDVIAKKFVLEFPHLSNPKEVKRVLLSRELEGTLDFRHPGFAFYNPDNGIYNLITEPLQA
jgi:hypothetical protein